MNILNLNAETLYLEIWSDAVKSLGDWMEELEEEFDFSEFIAVKRCDKKSADYNLEADRRYAGFQPI